MNWEISLNIAQLVETVVIIGTAFCGLYKYFYEKSIEKRNRTIEKVGELLEEYREKKFDEKQIKNERFMEYVGFLSKIEQFCIAVDSKVYSERTLKKYGSFFLDSVFWKYKDNVIRKRRSVYGDTSYMYLENLVKKFDKKRGVKNV